jgi:hypothetical protein
VHTFVVFVHCSNNGNVANFLMPPNPTTPYLLQDRQHFIDNPKMCAAGQLPPTLSLQFLF